MVKLPSMNQMREVAGQCGLALDDPDLESFRGLYSSWVRAYNLLAGWPEELPQVKYPRTPGYRPAAKDNPYNAWYRRTSIKGAAAGKLAGKTVVLKDNIMLAGVPMMNGSSTLEGYVPELDATVVTRVLEAGGEILGKAHCEFLCFSSSSHTNATGPVHNPHRQGFSAGGSSSGCAVLVAAGEADMAIGGDQGGSIRGPAAFCGIYGLKPTWGLVPYTGIAPLEVSVDHAGPMTRTVADNALLLEVLAGDDGFDPRIKAPRLHRYTEALGGAIKGMRIGMLREGFGHRNSEPDVDDKVRQGARRLAELGAVVEEFSLPLHLRAGALGVPILLDGLANTMMWGDGMGSGRIDLYATSLTDFHRGWRARADELSEPVKFALMFATYVHNNYGSHFYGKAINVMRQVRAAYDAALTKYDLLLMPTVPMKATPLPAPNARREEVIMRAIETTTNMMPFDMTHHPALNVPCGMSEGLPVGLMLVGRHFDEPTLYRAAHAFEQAGDWR